MQPDASPRLPLPINVLLIEDNATDAFLVRRGLGHLEAALIYLENAARLDSALMLLRLRRFDAVVLDCSADRGLQRLEKLLARGPNIPVVVIGDDDLDARAQEALTMGASGYLLKDEIGSPLLGAAIVAAVERSRQVALARYALG